MADSRVVNFLEDILESSIVFLEDSVLCRHEQRHFFGQSHLEGGLSEPGDRFIRVVHAHGHTGTLEVVDIQRRRLGSISWRIYEL